MRDDTLSPSGEAPRLNRRQAAKVRTRHKVLEAARSLFSERGYDPATIRDIAKGAGMSTGAVFANFQDKAELFDAVLSEDLGRMLADFRSGAGKDGPVSGRLAGALNAGYDRMLGQLPLMQAVVARSWFQPDAEDARQRALIRPLVEAIGQILQDGVGVGELRKDVDLGLVSRLIWDIYISNYRYAAYDGWDLGQIQALMKTQIDLVLARLLTGK
jgi:Transcriptional regulator